MVQDLCPSVSNGLRRLCHGIWKLCISLTKSQSMNMSSISFHQNVIRTNMCPHKIGQALCQAGLCKDEGYILYCTFNKDFSGKRWQEYRTDRIVIIYCFLSEQIASLAGKPFSCFCPWREGVSHAFRRSSTFSTHRYVWLCISGGVIGIIGVKSIHFIFLCYVQLWILNNSKIFTNNRKCGPTTEATNNPGILNDCEGSNREKRRIKMLRSSTSEWYPLGRSYQSLVLSGFLHRWEEYIEMKNLLE